MNEALAFHKAHGFDFSRLTVDNQGFVYAMNVYYAGPVTNNWAEGLWPHSHHLGSPVQLRPGMQAFDYQFTAIGAELELGTFCHENGHMLCDYPDLYDYGYESSGVGGYCLMCAGNNVSEKNPIPISAYLKRLSGWARHVTPLTHGATITLDADTNDFAIYSRGGREYFLIENRRRTGRDASLPDEGLAIWHVDEDGDNSHEQMTQWKPLRTLARAGRRTVPARAAAESGGRSPATSLPDQRARFADDTVPDSKWWNGTSSNLTIDQISPAGAVDRVPMPAGRRRYAAARHSSEHRRRTARFPTNNPAGITDTIDIAETLTIVEPEGRRGYYAHLSRRSQRHIDHAVGNGHRAAPEGTGRQRRRPEGDLRRDDAAGAGNSARAERTGQLDVDGQGPCAGRHRHAEPWSLDLSSAVAAVTPIELKESPGTKIPDAPSGGVVRSLATTSAAKIGSVEVSVDITHTWIGDLRVSVRSPSGTEAILHDGTGGSADNVVRTFTAANSPPLAALAGQPAGGTWQLNVADRAAQDEGKLNAWKVLIKPSA